MTVSLVLVTNQSAFSADRFNLDTRGQLSPRIVATPDPTEVQTAGIIDGDGVVRALQGNAAGSGGGFLGRTIFANHTTETDPDNEQLDPHFHREYFEQSSNADVFACCKGANRSLEVCETLDNVCREFLPGAVREEIPSGIRNLLNGMMTEAGFRPEQIRERNACDYCIGQEFENSLSEGEDYSFDTGLNAYRGFYNASLKREHVHEKFSALHKLNDSLFRLYGLHSKKLNELYRDDQDAIKKLTCTDPSGILDKITNPTSSDSVCGRRLESIARSDKAQGANEEERLEWARQVLLDEASSESFISNITGVSYDSNTPLETKLNNYFDNFNYGSEPQCVARADHAVVIAEGFHRNNSRNSKIRNSGLVTGLFD